MVNFGNIFFYYFFYLLLTTVTFILFAILIREAINYFSLMRFKRIGLKTYYYPIIGVIRLTMCGKNDSAQLYKDKNKENWQEKAIAGNYVKGIGRSLVSLIRSETIKKF